MKINNMFISQGKIITQIRIIYCKTEEEFLEITRISEVGKKVTIRPRMVS